MTDVRVKEIPEVMPMSSPGFSARKSQNDLTGLWTLIAFIFRRDKVRMIVWTLSIVGIYAYFVTVLGAMGQDALNARGQVMNTPAGILMGGPGFGVAEGVDYTIGVAMANEMILWVALTLAIMAIFHIVRHTRADEDTARSELIRANVVGRHAPAVAAFLSLVIAQVVIAVLGALAMHGANTTEMPLADSFAMTLGIAAATLTFGAFAVIACQITEHPRGASGMSMGFLGLMYVLRTAGDMAGSAANPPTNGSALSWLSPIGWAQQMAPFVDLRWWPIGLSLALTVVLLVIGSVLANKRDYGLGLIASKPGPADAKETLRSPLALAWRQQRTSFWSWAIISVTMWYATGTMIPEIAEMGMEAMADNEIFAQVFQLDTDMAIAEFAGQFMNVMGIFIALLYAAYAISTLNRLRSEEVAGRLEPLLATPHSRAEVLRAHLTVTGFGAAVLTVASMVVMWAGAASVGMGDPGLGAYLVTSLVYLAAIAVFAGFAAVLFGWFPGKAGWSWALIGWGFVFTVFGPMLLQNAPHGVQSVVLGISPLYHAPAVFTDDLNVGGLIGLLLVAGALFALAFAGFRRRDVPTV